MGSRTDLQLKLEELLGSENVYYQPPATVTMKYPAIVYSKSDVAQKFAGNKTYSQTRGYELVVIDKKPDNEVIDKLLALPYCKWARHYTADNLNHDVLTLYY